jgi:hypothetical protein
MSYKKIVDFILPKRIVQISGPFLNYDSCAAWRINVVYEDGTTKPVLSVTKLGAQDRVRKYKHKKHVRDYMHLIVGGLFR